jgi:hypothetical protein
MDEPTVCRLVCQGHGRVADVRRREALKASKRETPPKMRPPTGELVRPPEDDWLKRRHVDSP